MFCQIKVDGWPASSNGQELNFGYHHYYSRLHLKIMGDSKRRKDNLGEKYGQEPTILPWLPVSKTQAEQFVKWSTRGAWIGIVLLVIWWLVIRFIGPTFGWWQLQG